MQLQFICTHWGQEHLPVPEFMQQLSAEGYDGLEINIPESEPFEMSFMPALDQLRSEKTDFTFIGQQVLPPATETVDAYIQKMKKQLQRLAGFKPHFINSHTGKDYYSFDDNCRVIEAAMNVAEQSGVPVIHETHRGRFSFHAASLLPYLEKFPEMKLAADFSHWCAVSESLLQDQQSILDIIIPHVAHIHARVGYEHGPQVPDPFAPEWGWHLETHISWWKKIIAAQPKDKRAMTITPEAGPVPYMPAMPFTRQPLGDQWKINAGIKDLLKKELQATTLCSKNDLVMYT